GKGCRAAVGRFDRLAQRAQGTPPAWDGLLEGALCYRALSNFNEARVRLNALLRVDSHKDRARAELDRLDQMQQGQANAAPPAAAGGPKAAAALPARRHDRRRVLSWRTLQGNPPMRTTDRDAVIAAWSAKDRARAVLPADREIVDASAAVRALVVDLVAAG